MKRKIIPITSVFLLMIVFLSCYQASAQDGHMVCAPNCEYWKITGKTPPKGSVSCIDRSCPICSKKQKEEREKKENIEQQKIDAWKAGEKSRQASIKQKQQEAIKAKEKYLQKQKGDAVVLVAPKPKVSSNTEVIEPKKEIKPVSSKPATVDENKIKSLLSKVKQLYLENNGLQNEGSKQVFGFDFSNTEITIRVDGTKAISTYKKSYDIKFDLANLTGIGFDVAGVKVWIKDYPYEGYKGSFLIAGNKFYVQNPASEQVFELLKQAALEAGASLR